MAQWFVLESTQVLGPYTPSQLLVLVRLGKVTAQSKVRKDDSKWFDAGEVGGLFDAAVRPSLRLHCPGCQGIVTEPPCECPTCGRQLEIVHRVVIQNRILSPAEIASQNVIGTSMQSWLNKVRRKQ